MSETLKLWFFRDLNDDQRLKLFSLFGLPVDEIGNVHGRQAIALRHIVEKITDLIRDQSTLAEARAEALEEAAKVADLLDPNAHDIAAAIRSLKTGGANG